MKILQIPVAVTYLNSFVRSSQKENMPSLMWPPHDQWIFTSDLVVNTLCMHSIKELGIESNYMLQKYIKMYNITECIQSIAAYFKLNKNH